MQKRLIILLTFLFFLLFSSREVFAWIPGAIEGKVQVKLPNNQLIGLPGAYVYRTDYWKWDYCNTSDYSCNPSDRTGSCCWGTMDGVETKVRSDGTYEMSNDGNDPPPYCYTLNPGGQAKLCPAGEIGKVPRPAPLNRECNKTGEYYDTSPYKTGWCGMNCGFTKEKLEAYFPTGYHLPGNLEQQGYSASNGKWVSASDGTLPYREFQGANNGRYYNYDFIFILNTPPPLSPTLTPTKIPCGNPCDDHDRVDLECDVRCPYCAPDASNNYVCTAPPTQTPVPTKIPCGSPCDDHDRIDLECDLRCPYCAPDASNNYVCSGPSPTPTLSPVPTRIPCGNPCNPPFNRPADECELDCPICAPNPQNPNQGICVPPSPTMTPVPTKIPCGNPCNPPFNRPADECEVRCPICAPNPRNPNEGICLPPSPTSTPRPTRTPTPTHVCG